MNCADARALWQHAGGLIGGLSCRGHGYHEVLPALIEIAERFKKGLENPFDTAVKNRAGGDGSYYVEHRNDEDDLSRKIHDVIGDRAAAIVVSKYVGEAVGIPNLCIGNICCSSCITSDGPLSPEQNIAIQLAAVNTNADGSLIT